MRIKPEQLKNQLVNKLEPLYFIFGAEILLIEQSLTQINQAAKKQGFDEKISFEIDADFDWDKIINQINAASLFSPKRIIQCRLKSAKIGIKGAKMLAEIASSLPTDVLLIIVSGKLDKNQLNSKWVKILEQNGGLIQHWEVKIGNLLGWITNHMESAGLATNRAVAEAIVTCTQGNLLAAMQEIQKLKMAYPDGKIDLSQYQTQIDQQSQYTIYSLVDTALSGNSRQVLKIYNRLSTDSLTPIFLSVHLRKEISVLIKMAIELQQQKPIALIFKNHYVWESRKSIISYALKQHSYQQLQKLLLLLGRIDRSIKGVDNLVVNDQFCSLLLTLSGKTQWIQ